MAGPYQEARARRYGLAMIRHARIDDVPALMRIRAAVRENVLSDPARVPASLVEEFIARTGIWLWQDDAGVLGFAAADTRDGTVWALFVDPAHEGRGIARALLPRALDDLRAAGWRRATLSTQPGSRADRFYRRQGWIAGELTPRGERLFSLDL